MNSGFPRWREDTAHWKDSEFHRRRDSLEPYTLVYTYAYSVRDTNRFNGHISGPPDHAELRDCRYRIVFRWMWTRSSTVHVCCARLTEPQKALLLQYMEALLPYLGVLVDNNAMFLESRWYRDCG